MAESQSICHISLADRCLDPLEPLELKCLFGSKAAKEKHSRELFNHAAFWMWQSGCKFECPNMHKAHLGAEGSSVKTTLKITQSLGINRKKFYQRSRIGNCSGFFYIYCWNVEIFHNMSLKSEEICHLGIYFSTITLVFSKRQKG